MKTAKIARVIVGNKGGPGSGFHGHAGRQGKVGGSASTGSSKYPNMDMNPKYKKILESMLDKISPTDEQLKGITAFSTKPPEGYVDKPDGFVKSEYKDISKYNRRSIAAMHDPSSRVLYIHKRILNNYADVQHAQYLHVLAHEIGHATTWRIRDINALRVFEELRSSLLNKYSSIEGQSRLDIMHLDIGPLSRTYMPERGHSVPTFLSDQMEFIASIFASYKTGTQDLRSQIVDLVKQHGGDIAKYMLDTGKESKEVKSARISKVVIRGQKGGPGSGFHGHAGRPGKVGGSARSGTYSVLNEEDKPTHILTVAAGSHIDKDVEDSLISQAEAARQEIHSQAVSEGWSDEEDIYSTPVIYNAIKHMWHVAAEMGTAHDAYQDEAIGSDKEENTVKGIYHPLQRLLKLFDMTDPKLWGHGTDPIAERRSSHIANRSLESALANAFADSKGKLRTEIMSKLDWTLW